MSLFGALEWRDSVLNKPSTGYIDTVLSYRSSEVFGIGLSTFIDDFRFSAEFAYHITSDKIKSDEQVARSFNGGNSDFAKMCDDAEVNDLEPLLGPCSTHLNREFALSTDAEFYQYLIEFEYPNIYKNITLTGQYLKYKMVSISNGLHPVSTEINNEIIDFTTVNNFVPTLGSPIFMFTMHEDKDTKTLFMHEASVFYLNAKRYFMDHVLEANLRTFWDLNNLGNLIELEFKYKLSNRMNIGAAINKISGNSTLNNSYMFNTMENFSHLRVEATYNF